MITTTSSFPAIMKMCGPICPNRLNNLSGTP